MRRALVIAVTFGAALTAAALAEQRPVPRPDEAPSEVPSSQPAAKPTAKPTPPIEVKPKAEPEPEPEVKPDPKSQVEPPPLSVEVTPPPDATQPPQITVPLSPLNLGGILTALPPLGHPAMTAPGPDCFAALDAMGTRFTRPGPITETTPGCGIPDPVLVEDIVPGVSLNGAVPMRCEAALALAQWTRGFVEPAARVWAAQGHGVLTGYRTGSTYACRERIGDGSGKISEHAIGNAIDIASFTFADSPDLPVAPRAEGNDMETAFQRTTSGAACLFFTTVLGPGSDGAHENHLHLDVMPRKGGYRICQ